MNKLTLIACSALGYIVGTAVLKGLPELTEAVMGLM